MIFHGVVLEGLTYQDTIDWPEATQTATRNITSNTLNVTDLFIHKTVKTNDKIRLFGEVMTPLSRNDKHN